MDEIIFLWVVFGVALSGIETVLIIAAIRIARDSLEEKAREIKSFIKIKDISKKDALKGNGHEDTY